MIAWAVILFIAGVVLILAEFIVPGLICGALGGMLVIGSGAIGCYLYPDLALMIILGELAGVFAAIILGMYILSRTRAAKGLILEHSQQAEAGWVASDTDTSLAGTEGEVFTALRPAGTIVVNGKRVDAVADGSFIDKGERVRVIEIHGNRVVVEKTGDM